MCRVRSGPSRCALATYELRGRRHGEICIPITTCKSRASSMIQQSENISITQRSFALRNLPA